MRKALRAWPNLVLAGRRTVVFGRSKEKHTERILQSGDKLRIESSDGTVTVIVDRKRSVYDPAKNEIFETFNPFGVPGFGFMGGLPGGGDDFTFKESDGGIVAHHKTRLVVGTSDQGEEALRMYIDPEHGAVLKLEIFAPGKRLVMSFEFEAVRYDVDIPSRAFTLNFPDAKVVTVRDEVIKMARRMGTKPYVISKDSGLRLENARVFEFQGRKVMRQTYAGSRVKVSLFLCKGEVSTEKLIRSGGDRVRSRVWTIGDLTLVLLGDVDESDLKRFQQQVTVEERT